MPLSEMMELWKPCSCITSLVNRKATLGAEKGCQRAIKWAYLENRSNTTNMASYPLDLGRPSTKFIDRCSHVCAGMGIGWRVPTGAKVDALHCW